uniref:Protein translation factor SUI1 homolog n=1 Tax=Tanacetum cinerariifolium TaxID=118510 RepID=A0A6L2P3C0_TANCI|nr:protein translation factor SUI1 homolog [Tanacetum cinerariifolium]
MILKDMKEFCCNDTVVHDKELSKVIQPQGDQRKNVSVFLSRAEIVKKEQIKIHEEHCDGGYDYPPSAYRLEGDGDDDDGDYDYAPAA